MRKTILLGLTLTLLVGAAPVAAADHCDNYPQWPRRLICDLTHIDATSGVAPAGLPAEDGAAASLRLLP